MSIGSRIFGVFKNIGSYLEKAIVGAETLSPASGTGPTKKTVVAEGITIVIDALTGGLGEVLMAIPRVATAVSVANDATVALQKVLAEEHANLTAVPAPAVKAPAIQPSGAMPPSVAVTNNGPLPLKPA